MGAEPSLSFKLYAVYTVFLLASLAGSAMCLLLMKLLRKYDVFHINFRTILWNVVCCLLVNNIVQALRPLWAIKQEWSDSDYDASDCYAISTLPVVCCTFISISSIILAVERLYATMNYSKYEYENFSWLIDRLFLVMWFVFAVCGLASLTDLTARKSTYLQCALRQSEQSLLKSDWHLLLAILFQAVCLVMFQSVVSTNREKQAVYIKHYYNSLSPRFQIGENIKATRLLVSFTMVVFVSMLMLLAHSWWQRDYFGTATDQTAALFHQELGLLIMPMCTIAMVMTFILRSQVFFAKTRLFVKEFLQSNPLLLSKSAARRNSVQGQAEGRSVDL